MEETCGFEQEQSHVDHQAQQYPNDHQSHYDPSQQQPPPPQQDQFTASQTAGVNFTFQSSPNPQPYRPGPRPSQYPQAGPAYVNPAHRPPPYSPAHHNAGPTPPPPQYHHQHSPKAGYGPGQGRVDGSPAAGYPFQPPQPLIMVATEPWSSGLFDCMNDPSNALITAFCPCITFGQIAEIIDNGHSTCATSGVIYAIAYSFGLPCLISATYRTKLRNMLGLTETPAPDFLTHLLCEWCAVCQAFRQLRDSGYDPAIGWEGNAAKRNLEALQRNQIQMTPPNNERMMA